MLKILILLIIINYLKNNLSKGGYDVVHYFPYKQSNKINLIACANHSSDTTEFYISDYNSTFKSKQKLIRDEVVDIIKFMYYYYLNKYTKVQSYNDWTIYDIAVLRSCMEGGVKWAQLAHSLKLYAYQLIYNENINENVYELYCNNGEINKGIETEEINDALLKYANEISKITCSQQKSQKTLKINDILLNEDYIPDKTELAEKSKFKLITLKNSIDPVVIKVGMKKKAKINLNCYFAYISTITHEKIVEVLCETKNTVELNNGAHCILLTYLKSNGDNRLIDVEIKGIMNSDGDGMMLLGETNQKYLVCVNRDEKTEGSLEFIQDNINISDENIKNQAHLIKSFNEIFTLAYWIKSEKVDCFINIFVYFPNEKDFMHVISYEINKIYYFGNAEMRKFRDKNLTWIE